MVIMWVVAVRSCPADKWQICEWWPLASMGQLVSLVFLCFPCGTWSSWLTSWSSRHTGLDSILGIWFRQLKSKYEILFQELKFCDVFRALPFAIKFSDSFSTFSIVSLALSSLTFTLEVRILCVCYVNSVFKDLPRGLSLSQNVGPRYGY